MAFLEAFGLRKSFDGQPVLSDLSFSIERGELYGLVGPNGAGKTTTINILCSALEPDGGRVMLDGHEIASAARGRIGIATQDVALYRDLTCEQNLRFFASLYGLRGSERSSRVAESLHAAGLRDRANTMVSQLSGGMRRRLHVTAATLHQPELLILDEPTVGLDLESRHQIWDLIRNLAGAGASILVTTHQLDEAETLCQRVGILHQGHLVAEGSMPELRRVIPAVELVVVEADDREAVVARALELGLAYRQSLAAVTVWLPERKTLDEVAAQFRGVALQSLRLKPIGLEEVFAEVTGRAAPT